MESQVGFELNLFELFHYLKKKILIIVAAFMACAMLGFAFFAFFTTPQYVATTRVYVLNRSNETSVVYSDFTLSTYMLSDYQVLITGNNVTKEVIEKLDLDMTNDEMRDKLTVTAVEDTRVLQISAMDPDPNRAADIVNCVREVASRQITEMMDVDAVNLVYAADVPNKPVSSNVLLKTILVGFLGLAAAVFVLAVIFVVDDTIRTEEDVEKYLGLSTLGVIPASSELEGIGRTAPAKRHVKPGAVLNFKK